MTREFPKDIEDAYWAFRSAKNFNDTHTALLDLRSRILKYGDEMWKAGMKKCLELEGPAP